MAVLTCSESLLHQRLRAPPQPAQQPAQQTQGVQGVGEALGDLQLRQLQVWLNEMVVASKQVPVVDLVASEDAPAASESRPTTPPSRPPSHCTCPPGTADTKDSATDSGSCSCASEQGFFRRSIQQKIQYRPCTKNQQCSILRINRNRCQYCRLKKCISVGMSRDAVRFGRVPKREKARILAAMQQSSNSRSAEKAVAAELEDESALFSTVVRAHLDTCDFTRDKVEPMLARARDQPSYTACPPTLTCPLNPNPVPLSGQQELLQDFSKRFSPAIRGVVEFAKKIPGFLHLAQDDQVTLLKAGVFEVLLVRLACLFDSQTNSMVCLNGQVLKRESVHNSSNARFLMDSMFEFAERLNSLRLSDAEIALFCSIVVVAPDRPGLRNTELVERMHNKLKQALQVVVSQNHPGQMHIVHDLMKKVPDLRTLNTLHSEKLLAFKMTEQQQLQSSGLPGLSGLHGHHGSSASSASSGMWGAVMMCSEVDDSSKSPAGSSSWSSASDATMDEVVKSPLGSVSSSESVCSGEVASLTDSPYPGSHHGSQHLGSHASSAPLLAATLAGTLPGCPMRHRANSGSTSGDDEHHGMSLSAALASGRPLIQPHHRFPRKLDSPSDSGIESGTEKLDKLGAHSAPTSVCSSPRSSLEDKDEHSHPSHVEDMPVLKRVLQAPPLCDTNSLMDEAYKPHKKFRALRHKDSAEAEPMVTASPRSPAPPATPPTTHTSSLSSTHSTLARSLRESPLLTAEQIKRTEAIHTFIMSGHTDNYHPYIPPSPQQQRWSTTASASASSGVITSASAAFPYANSTSSPSPPPSQPGAELSRIYLSRSPACSPSSTGHGSPHVAPHHTALAAHSPKLVELQVGIAANSQPLNLSKKSPSPSPRPLSAPQPASHKAVSMEA